VTYVASLHRAKKEHKCELCKKPIKPGEFYVQYYEYGMGTHYWHLYRKWCARCAEDEVRKMLIFNTNKLGGLGFWLPCGKPLDEETKKELLKVVGMSSGRWALEQLVYHKHRYLNVEKAVHDIGSVLSKELEELEKQGIIDSSWRNMVYHRARVA
jgi:hypothetical protein